MKRKKKIVEPHLAATHEQYPDGFPAREDDGLLGHWPTEEGMVVVENHPHGYEIHFLPCYDFDVCDGCSPDRGTSNPHTRDGHDFRRCVNRGGPILTVGGDKRRTVLEYLSIAGSSPHVIEFAALVVSEQDAINKMRERERVENEEAMRLAESFAPSIDERLAAVEAEYAALREIINQPGKG